MADKTLQMVMTADPTGQELVRFAEQTALALVKQNLKSSQIRNIFTEVRRIQAQWRQEPDKAVRRLSMLRPKLAYQAKRNKEVAGLRDVLTEAIDQVVEAPAEEREERFRRLADLFEAILAYHRAQGGRD
jgi:CRISPR-associated protein Csm2